MMSTATLIRSVIAMSMLLASLSSVSGMRGASRNIGESGPYPQRVHGGWGQWSQWSSCDRTCGGGRQSRDRRCNNPRPQNGGRDCLGLDRTTRICNRQFCPIRVNGGWAAWSEWTQCSKTCQGGSQTRSRRCTNPPPSNGGDPCDGRSVLRRQCNQNIPCSADGGWSSWSDWSSCTSRCGGGTQSRSRSCTNPRPSGAGMACDGSPLDQQPCNEDLCSVDGGWTEWGEWSQCSTSCGQGFSSRRRTCTNPSPAGGGDDCTGRSQLRKQCSGNRCSVDGSWSNWSQWSACSVSCGAGSQSRQRSCTNPSPLFGGSACSGSIYDSRLCNQNIGCQVHGGWTQWSSWSACSTSCGNGNRRRDRTCTAPAPSPTGRDCTGFSYDYEQCNENNECREDGGWTEWSLWSSCSASCNGGSKRRVRSCTNPPPLHGGALCEGPQAVTEDCNYDILCVVNGRWSPWSDWTSCSKTCGGGDATRQRTCSNPPPINGGEYCDGAHMDVRSCNRQTCAVNGGWTEWTEWSACSTSCGGGVETRSRTCSNPTPLAGGQECEGPQNRYRKCNVDTICPVDGGWSQWSAFGACSSDCGRGTYGRFRSCTNPPPSSGGLDCHGASTENQTCIGRSGCQVDGGWGEWSRWSDCTVTCGVGISGRYRVCDSPTPSNGGRYCEGGTARSGQGRNCNLGHCLVTPVWSDWGSWSVCSSRFACREGTRSRTRTCIGDPCQGSPEVVEVCRGTVSCSFLGESGAQGETGPDGGASSYPSSSSTTWPSTSTWSTSPTTPSTTSRYSDTGPIYP